MEVLQEVTRGVDIEVDSVADSMVVDVVPQVDVVAQVGHFYQSKTTLSLKGSPFVLSANKSTLHINASN